MGGGPWRVAAGTVRARRFGLHYASTGRELTSGAPHVPVVYLSNGPWNLAGPLARFLETHGFPPGALLLTDWGPTPTRWFRDGQAHKRSSLQRLADDLPGVRWTLVGDTIRQTKELAYAKRRLNLSAELENAKNLFEAAGIRVRITRAADTDPSAGELLGQVLRETTTNILRHAQARRGEHANGGQRDQVARRDQPVERHATRQQRAGRACGVGFRRQGRHLQPGIARQAVRGQRGDVSAIAVVEFRVAIGRLAQERQPGAAAVQQVPGRRRPATPRRRGRRCAAPVPGGRGAWPRPARPRRRRRTARRSSHGSRRGTPPLWSRCSWRR